MDGPEDLELFGLLRSLEAAIVEESKKCEVLLPFIGDIYACLSSGNFAAALLLLNELEEYMDLEFCER